MFEATGLQGYLNVNIARGSVSSIGQLRRFIAGISLT